MIKQTITLTKKDLFDILNEAFSIGVRYKKENWTEKPFMWKSKLLYKKMGLQYSVSPYYTDKKPREFV